MTMKAFFPSQEQFPTETSSPGNKYSCFVQAIHHNYWPWHSYKTKQTLAYWRKASNQTDFFSFFFSKFSLQLPNRQSIWYILQAVIKVIDISQALVASHVIPVQLCLFYSQINAITPLLAWTPETQIFCWCISVGRSFMLNVLTMPLRVRISLPYYISTILDRCQQCSIWNYMSSISQTLEVAPSLTDV